MCKRNEAIRLIALLSAVLLLSPTLLGAGPTQDEVFKSISDNVGEQTDYSKLLPIAAAGVGLILLLLVASRWRTGDGRPKKVNSQGKLHKEILKLAPVRPAEMKQLKLLVEEPGIEPTAGDPEPLGVLTLLLCPSVMTRSIALRQARGGKVDRKALSSVARKAGVTREMLESARGELAGKGKSSRTARS